MGTNDEKSIVKKYILPIIAGAAVFVICLFLFFRFFGLNTESEDVLAKVKNIQYNSYYFSWDSVEHADSYIADINGEQTTVFDNEIYHVPLSERTEIKVKPVDSAGVYASPDWSVPYVYVLDNEFSYSSVGAYINNVMSPSKLIKIVNAYVKNNSLYTDSVFLDNGEVKLMQLQIKYNESVTSIEDCMSKKFSAISFGDQYKLADYDSANYFLQSSTYVGKLEARRLEGYDFSVVTSQVTKFDEARNCYNIFAIYKLTRGDEVKYVSSNVRCSIINKSSSEKVNYTTKLLNQDDVFNQEYSYVELKGDEVELAVMMEHMNKPAA